MDHQAATRSGSASSQSERSHSYQFISAVKTSFLASQNRLQGVQNSENFAAKNAQMLNGQISHNLVLLPILAPTNQLFIEKFALQLLEFLCSPYHKSHFSVINTWVFTDLMFAIHCSHKSHRVEQLVSVGLTHTPSSAVNCHSSWDSKQKEPIKSTAIFSFKEEISLCSLMLISAVHGNESNQMHEVRLCNGWNNVTTMSDFNPFCSDLIALDYISFVFTESRTLLPAAANI